ncbi:MAG: carboxypeptidase-like regulatory domain-containing protein [Planctomycetota bacterium]
MSLRTALLAIVAGLALVACGGGGGGSGPTFNLTYEAPTGSGLEGGQADGFYYMPSVRTDLVLFQGVAVTGLVTDGSGDPLVDAEVSFRISAVAPDMESDGTNDSGIYSLMLPAGTWTAIVDSNSSSLGSMTIAGIIVDAPGPATIDFRFPTLVGVSGAVFDSSSIGIDRAEVTFRGAESGSKVTVECDPTGAYAAALVPDSYEAVVTPTGAAAATHLKERFPAIDVAGPTQRDFVLTRGVVVSGTIFMDSGLPVDEDADMEVILPDDSAFFAPDKVESNGDDGSYSIGPVPVGTRTFRIEAPGDSGFPAQQFNRLILGPGNQTEDFTLAAGFVLSGVILRDDGTTPEGNVKIEPVPRDGSLAPEDDRTDGSGRFDISLFAGTFDVQITPRQDNLQLPEVRTVTVTGPTPLSVVLTRGVILAGTVYQPDGLTPQPDIRVEIPGALGASEVSDNSGVYALLAPAGTHTLVLTAERGLYKDIALASIPGVIVAPPGPATQDLTIALAMTGSTVVRGTTFAPDGTTPVGGVEIVARDNGSRETVGRTISDSNGDYRLVIP